MRLPQQPGDLGDLLVQRCHATLEVVPGAGLRALEQARDAAGDKDVYIAGGANVIQQYLAAGLVDEFLLHVTPHLLGGGVRLFDGVGPEAGKLELVETIPSELVTHIRYRVAG